MAKRTFGWYVKSMVPGYEERGVVFKKQVFVPEKALAQVTMAAVVGLAGAFAEMGAQAIGKRTRRWLDQRAEKSKTEKLRVKENEARREREQQAAAGG